MKIKATQSFGNAVTGVSYQSGVAYEVDDVEGAALIAAGIAVEVKPKAVPAPIVKPQAVKHEAR